LPSKNQANLIYFCPRRFAAPKKGVSPQKSRNFLRKEGCRRRRAAGPRPGQPAGRENRPPKGTANMATETNTNETTPVATAPAISTRQAGFVAQLRAFAAAQSPGTEWDLLPPEDAAVAALVGPGRKWNRVVDGVGDKLRVLRASPALGVLGVAPLSFAALKAHPVNAPAPAAPAANLLPLPAPVVEAAPAETAPEALAAVVEIAGPAEKRRRG
jgi:hypothetical protein